MLLPEAQTTSSVKNTTGKSHGPYQEPAHTCALKEPNDSSSAKQAVK